jgi:hypothetical protein
MTNTKSSNFIVTNTDTAGAISYWRLSGDTTLAKLTQAWQAEGLDAALLPSEPSAEVAIRRAVVSQESANRKAFKIKGGDFNGGWGLVEVDTKDGHVNTTELIRARWDVGYQIIRTDINTLSVETSKISNEIQAAFRAARVTLASTDIGGWLVKLADGKAATSLRDSGGIYFVPRPNVAFWEQVARAIQAAGEHRVFRIPALHCDEAVEAILDSITREARDAAEEIEAELAARTEESGIGDRALASRKVRCEKLLDKIRSYETLLGVKLPEIQTRIEGLAGSVVAAALAA